MCAEWWGGCICASHHSHVCLCVHAHEPERLFIIVSDQILPSGGSIWAALFKTSEKHH